MRLDGVECAEVLRRWADHLLSSPHLQQKDRSLLLLLSLAQFPKVVELLFRLRHYDRAALLVEACREFGLMDAVAAGGEGEMAPLVQSVYLEYARWLLGLGMREACEHYCRQAGDKGKQLLGEVQRLAGLPVQGDGVVPGRGEGAVGTPGQG